jgi:hypothetical protein
LQKHQQNGGQLLKHQRYGGYFQKHQPKFTRIPVSRQNSAKNQKNPSNEEKKV